MKHLLFGIFGLFAALILPAAASAATVSLSLPVGTHAVLDPVPVSVYLNTGEEPVNAASIVIKFDPAAADVSSPSRAGSNFDVWIAAPKVAGSTVRFEGASTTPFSGTGKVGEFMLTPKQEGALNLSATPETVAYRADGTGTPIALSSIPLTLTVAPATETAPPVVVPDDHTPPEQAMLDVGPDGNGGWIAAWSVTDAGSGYDRAEISIDGKEFRRAESPYQLGAVSPDTVTLRVYDRAGNARELTKDLRTGFRLHWPAVSVAVLVVLLLTLLFVRRWARKNRRT